VRVYAGVDPVTKARLYLDETIPPGPRAAREAERAKTRLLARVDERRNPRTRATVDQMLDRYLSVLDVEPTTKDTYDGYICNHIRPALGTLLLAKLDGETVDAFYAQLRTCRTRCRGRRRVDHRSEGEHVCDHRCCPHECRPLAAATVRQIHAILNSACERAVRWKWISVSPVDGATPPAAPAPNPQPPSSEQAARICAEAWKDPDWGMFVWLAMMTGARRGEADIGYPDKAASPIDQGLSEDASPYQGIAGDIRGAIACGALVEGDQIPTLKALAERYGVPVGTAQRAVALLASTGYVQVRSGHRSLVRARSA
jgi:hypothetical protein